MDDVDLTHLDKTTYTARAWETAGDTVTAVIYIGPRELGEVMLVGDELSPWGDTIDHWASDGVVAHLLAMRQPERNEAIVEIVEAVRRAMWDHRALWD